MQFSLKIEAVVPGSSEGQLLCTGRDALLSGWWGRTGSGLPGHWESRAGLVTVIRVSQEASDGWASWRRSAAKPRCQVWWPAPGGWVARHGHGHGHGCGGAVLGRAWAPLWLPSQGSTESSPSSFSHGSFPGAWCKGRRYQGLPWGQAAKDLGQQRQQRLLLHADSPWHLVPPFSQGNWENLKL